MGGALNQNGMSKSMTRDDRDFNLGHTPEFPM